MLASRVRLIPYYLVFALQNPTTDPNPKTEVHPKTRAKMTQMKKMVMEWMIEKRHF